jgi:hypothetical protein
MLIGIVKQHLGASDMKQFKVAMSDDLRGRLEAVSAKSGRSIADEIRVRVEATFALETVDKPTRDFLEGLALMPAEIEHETGAAWHKHAGAYVVFREAILRRLARLKPEGTIAFGRRPHQAIPGDDPEGIGLSIEENLSTDPNYTHSAWRAAMEKSYREIVKLHQQRQRKGDKS